MITLNQLLPKISTQKKCYVILNDRIVSYPKPSGGRRLISFGQNIVQLIKIYPEKVEFYISKEINKEVGYGAPFTYNELLEILDESIPLRISKKYKCSTEPIPRIKIIGNNGLLII